VRTTQNKTAYGSKSWAEQPGFRNQKIYVPDTALGVHRAPYIGSPLEIPAAPASLKVFDASL
jgi:hypothetical protein